MFKIYLKILISRYDFKFCVHYFVFDDAYFGHTDVIGINATGINFQMCLSPHWIELV